MTGRSSQVHIGVTPKASMKAKTTIMLRPKVNSVVRTTESGMTSRGNWVLRTMPSCPTTDATELSRRFLKEAEEDDVEQQQHFG